MILIGLSKLYKSAYQNWGIQRVENLPILSIINKRFIGIYAVGFFSRFYVHVAYQSLVPDISIGERHNNLY